MPKYCGLDSYKLGKVGVETTNLFDQIHHLFLCRQTKPQLIHGSVRLYELVLLPLINSLMKTFTGVKFDLSPVSTNTIGSITNNFKQIEGVGK